jgi:glycosyltransferase involved in cell wall biosynthesis
MNLTIVIPIYNSSNILEKLILNIYKNLKKLNKKYEIILVNDASIDGSWLKILKLQSKYKFIKSINLKYNIGQHGAIFVGLKFAKGSKIIIMDDDLQHPPEYILDIYDKLDVYDSCYTSYVKRKHFFWKIIISKINHYFSSLLFDKPFNIYLSSFKGLNLKIKDSMIKEKPRVIFLDALILKYSKKITSIPVKHKPREVGASNYNLTKLIILWFDMIENFHFYPIRTGSFIGIIFYLFVKILRINKKDKTFKFKIIN